MIDKGVGLHCASMVIVGLTSGPVSSPAKHSAYCALLVAAINLSNTRQTLHSDWHSHFIVAMGMNNTAEGNSFQFYNIFWKLGNTAISRIYLTIFGLL